MEKKFLDYLKNFELLDLIGIARILGVPDIEDFEEYITQIVYKFSLQDRKHRKEMLKLARQVSEENLKNGIKHGFKDVDKSLVENYASAAGKNED